MRPTISDPNAAPLARHGIPLPEADAAGPGATGARDGEARRIRRLAASYALPDGRRALLQLAVTIVPFLLLMAGILVALDHRVWAGLLLVVPAAALLVRLFIIQHDCGHGSFFKSRRANDLLGRVIGVLTLTPYAFWRKSHMAHHATSGNLDRRGVGDITTLTVREYLATSPVRRLLYRLYRHPLVMFGIGPAYMFLLRHRIPTGNPLRNRDVWLSILGTNVVIVALFALLAWPLGLTTLLLGYLPVMQIAAAIGVWLFYVQHQFEDTYWAKEPAWDFHDAALEGCSYYDLPRLLHWVTGYIGFHHLHHLCSRIPNYRLRECFDAHPEFWRAKRLTLLGSIRSARLALWDEASGKLVRFSQAAAPQAA